MQWNDIQRAARDRGVLVYAIDQSQAPPLTQPGPWAAIDPRAGYCMGLVANWVALAYQGKDFPFSNQECDNPPWQATLAQTVDAKAFPAGTFSVKDWVNEWKAVLAPFSCCVTGLKAEQAAAPSADFICQIAFKSYGCYGVSMRRKGEPTADGGKSLPGGHAAVIRNGRDGQLHLFDPNQFHLAMSGDDPAVFKSFVSWWLEATGYRTRYTVLTGVVGIRPPINHTRP
jgi:hypothetical protein